MFVLEDLLVAVAKILDWLLTAFYFLLIARVVISWVNADPYNPLVKFLHAVSEPALRPFRRILPPWRTGGLDVSPIFVFLVIMFLQYFLVRVLLHAAEHVH